MVDEGVLTTEEIARAAGVARGTVSDWRRRHADFPAPVSGTGRGPVFNQAEVEVWLAARPRWHLHFVSTYSSWLNLVERFFARITGRAIRRGSFRSVHELIQRIDHFVANHNTDCKPFIWTATADSILAKLQRFSMRISGTAH